MVKFILEKQNFLLKKRFKEHCGDSKKVQCERRPLYDAMCKYGVENFSIETIEETNNPEEREKYWIEYYGSFKNGYNATIGGDGKPYLDYDLIIKTYQEIKNISEVSEFLNIDKGYLSKILKAKNINVLSSQEVNVLKNGKSILMLDKNTLKPQKSFSSISDASRYIRQEQNLNYNLSGIKKHIREAARGERKTAYNYVWKFT